MYYYNNKVENRFTGYIEKVIEFTWNPHAIPILLTHPQINNQRAAGRHSDVPYNSAMAGSCQKLGNFEKTSTKSHRRIPNYEHRDLVSCLIDRFYIFISSSASPPLWGDSPSRSALFPWICSRIHRRAAPGICENRRTSSRTCSWTPRVRLAAYRSNNGSVSAAVSAPPPSLPQAPPGSSLRWLEKELRLALRKVTRSERKEMQRRKRKSLGFE